jgi:hypothetical protein
MGWIIALMALVLGAAGGLVSFSARAGALETRMDHTEKAQATTDMDMKKVLDSLARIEQKVSDLGK